MLITLYKIGAVHFRLLDTNGFHVKAKNDRVRVVIKTSNMKISRRRLADYVKTLHQKACRTCSTIIFLHSTNQIIDLWRCRWRCRRQILNTLILIEGSNFKWKVLRHFMRSLEWHWTIHFCHLVQEPAFILLHKSPSFTRPPQPSCSRLK